jgi:hypothetical protein
MNKKIQVSILSIFIAAALIGSVVTIGYNMAFATTSTSNDAAQAIEQGQGNSQGAQCVAAGSSGDEPEKRQNPRSGIVEEKPSNDRDFSGILASCNNVDLQFQNNEGNLALGQQ